MNTQTKRERLISSMEEYIEQWKSMTSEIKDPKIQEITDRLYYKLSMVKAEGENE